MRDDEIEDPLELPPEDPLTAMLERLDSSDDEDLGVPNELPLPAPPLSRRELDALVEQVLDEELRRINGRRG